MGSASFARALARRTAMQRTSSTPPTRYTIWGSELSPFSLKVRALCEFARVPFDWAPAGVSIATSLRTYRQVIGLTKGTLDRTYPPKDPLDEYPLVPFLFSDDGRNLYDSTAIAEWLDLHHNRDSRRLIPNDPACAFVARLIDEHFDEFGLYVAHHNRWVVSARDNDAGERVGEEFARGLPRPLRRALGARFARRQVRRLPYLFSVASEGFSIPGCDASLTPPSVPGFPPTHALLDEAFSRCLDHLEAILQKRPFVLGTRFTLADASVYGQLAINVHDPSAEAVLRTRAPATRRWVQTLLDGGAASFADGDEPTHADLALLEPLLEEITGLFIPLMQQNEAAYERHRAKGQTRFNERAFDAGEALYDGALRGHRFRSVAKTFQVKAWRDLQSRFTALGDADIAALPSFLAASMRSPCP